ncbi:hypothetical protein J5Y09_20960 [Roseomonas sp. PWR1]|uniref:Alpha-L-arabinofuranosidase 1 catalytic domain-containing protein n=1 Tax=Roseomonas nitratireducens TaxID=2820810 RepID=A0ABS4AYF4_9PROT|nr:hypothetical protein [Neoroseomonas nitratireducens]MBP0466411.1 hypothetical protein [Neoroseomonas nitratireducens]
MRIAALVLLTALALAGPARALVANGDFSAGGTPPAGWSLDGAVAGKGSLRILPGGVLELSPNGRNTPGPQPYAIGQLLPAEAVRGRRLTLEATLGAEGGATAVVGLAVLRRGAEPLFVTLRGDGAPSRRAEALSVPDGRAIEGAIVFVAVEGTRGAARFASVSLAAAAAPAAAPPAAPAPAVLPARVRVATDTVRRQIPRGIFGTNIEVIRDANGLWEAEAGRLQPEITAIARGLGISLVRFPGGVWSDAYDWRHGIGPQSARATTPTHPGATETYRHGFGTDEALGFARQIGAGLLVTVNAGNGTARMAADWVRYVNGEGGRSPRDGRVEWWEIGNELYIDGDASGGHTTPERYADRVVEFARAMRAVDPQIRIMAIGLRNFGRYRFNAFDRWNEVVLRRAGGEIDALAVHNAYAPLVADGREADPLAVYAAMWAFPRQVARNLADTRAEIARFAPARAGRIALAVTEWGPLFAIDPASPWIDHAKTMGSAIYVASILAAFAEEPALEVANFFKLNEPMFMGWIGRRGGRWVANANAEAFRMVSRGMEAGLLATEVEVATYATRDLGFVAATRDVPYLDALATRAADGRVLTLLLVNKHPGAAIEARIALAGATGAASVTAETLSAEAPDAHVGTELLRIPGLRWAEQARAGPRGRFHLGGEGEIRLERRELGRSGAETVVRVPPHAITLLRFEGLGRP